MVAPYFGFPRVKLHAPDAPRHRKHPGWPELTDTVALPDGGSLQLRPLMISDRDVWIRLRLANKEFLEPVEPTVSTSWEHAHASVSWEKYFANLRYLASEGTVIPMVIELDGQFVGQLTMGNIQHGVVSECWIGYWVDHGVTGRGVAKAAVALGTDLAFQRIGVHRVTATYLPANPASGAVLKANGYREEGLLRRNLHIGGSWQDHLLMAIVADDFTDTAVQRLREDGGLR